MRQTALKFIFYTLLIAVGCALLQVALNMQTNEYIHLKSGFLLLGIFVVIIISVHLLLLKSAQASGQGFVGAFMAATVVKLFTYLGVLICFFLFSQENKKVLALYFLFYYFVFTVFEVGMLYNDLRKK